MDKVIPVITIDGPSGSGKGTLSRLLADRLSFHFLDSGALYRLVAFAGLKQGLDLSDEDALVDLARNLDVEFVSADQGTEILLDKQKVTDLIRTEEAGQGASIVASSQAVRAALLQRQRDFQQAPGLVADGRDMGTVVFPKADLKIFLTASAEERAERRLKQLIEQGESAKLSAVLASIRERDERDKNRAVAPLVPADDAVNIDTTGISIDTVLARVMTLVEGCAFYCNK